MTIFTTTDVTSSKEKINEDHMIWLNYWRKQLEGKVSLSVGILRGNVYPFAKALQENTSLQHLTLRNKHLSSNELIALLSSLKGNTTLLSLNLDQLQKKLPYPVTEALVNLINQNRTIKSLRLNADNFCYEQIEELVFALETNSSIIEFLSAPGFSFSRLDKLLLRNMTGQKTALAIEDYFSYSSIGNARDFTPIRKTPPEYTVPISSSTHPKYSIHFRYRDVARLRERSFGTLYNPSCGYYRTIMDLLEIYREGKYVYQSPKMAFQLSQEASLFYRGIEVANRQACYRRYGNGLDSRYKKRVDRRYLAAFRIQGLFHEQGFGTEKNLVRAFKCYQQAEEYGKKELGRCYEKGFGVKKNEKKAFECYLESKSHYDLYRCYRFGIGVKRNVAKAREHRKHSKEDVKKIKKPSTVTKAPSTEVQDFKAVENAIEKLLSHAQKEESVDSKLIQELWNQAFE